MINTFLILSLKWFYDLQDNLQQNFARTPVFLKNEIKPSVCVAQTLVPRYKDESS